MYHCLNDFPQKKNTSRMKLWGPYGMMSYSIGTLVPVNKTSSLYETSMKRGNFYDLNSIWKVQQNRSALLILRRLPQFVFLHGRLHGAQKTVGSIFNSNGNSNCMLGNERNLARFSMHTQRITIWRKPHIYSTCMHDHMILTFKTSGLTRAQVCPPPSPRTESTER